MSFIVQNAYMLTEIPTQGDIIDFCGSGLNITGDGISVDYTQPGDGSVVTVSANYVVNDTCAAGGSTQWDP